MSVVASSPGAGKTTLAREVAARIGAPHIELDALFWGPRWTPVSAGEYHRRVTDAVARERWVLDGNYHSVRDLIWPRADTVVWLDYPLRIAYPRLVRRTLERLRAGEELWPGTGNRESFRLLFLSWDSILWWALRTYRGRRKRFEADLAEPHHAHLLVIRLRSPRRAEEWLWGVDRHASG